MALDANDVRVGVTGAVYAAADTTATLPTDASSTPDAAFLDVGYISEDGVTESYNDETTEIKAWQSGVTVRRLITGSTCNLSFTMIESNAKAVELYHKGSSIISDGAGGAELNVIAPTTQRRRFVIDVIDGTDIIRIVVPDGEVTERGEVVYKNDEVTGYPVTITCYPTTQAGTENTVLVKYSNAAGWSET